MIPAVSNDPWLVACGAITLVVGEGERLIGVTMVVPSCSELEIPVVAGGETVTTEVLEMEGRIPVLVGSAVLMVCGGSVAIVGE